MEKKISRLAEPWMIHWSLKYCLIVILVAVLVTAVIYHRRDDRRPSNIDSINVDIVHVQTSPPCDFFAGKWVFDNNFYGLYKDDQCEFMIDDLACKKYGRKDLNYQKWRWQPHNCDLPRFNATKLLERLRGKRLAFVGDSLNRNQWVSLVCMVEGSIPKGYKFWNFDGNLYSFIATGYYNTTIDFYWSPLLVESNSDDPSHHHTTDIGVRVDSIEKHAIHWNDADVLVFNSYLWWRVMLKKRMEVVWGSFENPRKVKQVRYQSGYEMALQTWSDWIYTHVNRTKTKLFFVSSSANHYHPAEWGGLRGQNCLNETEPLSQGGYLGDSSDPRLYRRLEEAISNLKTRGVNVQLLNITQLTGYRKDAHPSIYKKQWRPLTKEQLENPVTYADCSHWCLPGVPDFWNIILYAYLV